MNYGDYFKGKRVTVMRIGLLGRGVGDTAYMAEAGAEVTVVDSARKKSCCHQWKLWLNTKT